MRKPFYAEGVIILGTIVVTAALGVACKEVTVPTSLNEVNRHPTVITPINRVSVVGATIVAFTIQAEDPDGDALTYDATGLPPGIIINNTSGEVSGTVSNSAVVQKYMVELMVTDNGMEPPGLSTSAIFSWRVVPAGGEVFTNSIGMEMMRLVGGTFDMGYETLIGWIYPFPIHAVTLTRDFYIGIYEVMQDEYETVMGINPSHFTGNNRRPVEEVTWKEAIQFANALSVREGYAPCFDQHGIVIDGGYNPYECEGYRLLMEAEWEYAARAGTTSYYSFGDNESDLDNYAWHPGNSGNETHPVGKNLPNPWGFYDIHGNVQEWVFDRIVGYPSGPTENPTGGDIGETEKRGIRGGSWSWSHSLPSAARESFHLNNSRNDIGFRLARTAK